jgi:hypothetical protein
MVHCAIDFFKLIEFFHHKTNFSKNQKKSFQDKP